MQKIIERFEEALMVLVQSEISYVGVNADMKSPYISGALLHHWSENVSLKRRVFEKNNFPSSSCGFPSSDESFASLRQCGSV